jgi:hypothetical protein
MPEGHDIIMKILPTDLNRPVFQRAALQKQSAEHAFYAEHSCSCFATHMGQSVDYTHVQSAPPRLFTVGKPMRHMSPGSHAQFGPSDPCGPTTNEQVAVARLT